MASSGCNYYLNNFSSFNLEENWKIWFQFKDLSNITQSVSGANTLYSGIYTGFSTSYDIRNISKTTGNQRGFIQISPATGLWSDQFSLVFLNKKSDYKKSIIFNCLETGVVSGENLYKGFVLGYSDGGNPYFAYRDNEGFKIKVSDFRTSESHVLFFTRDGDEISIGQYNVISESINSNSFSINSQFLFEPSSYYLGAKTGNYFPNILESNSYTQYIDEFMFFSKPLYEFDIQMISSGWISDFNEAQSGSGFIYTSGITGYENYVYTTTGITGWGITGTGFLTDIFGISYSGYLTGNLTGSINLSGLRPISGVVITVEEIEIPESIVINSGFIKNFYQKNITFLKNIDNNDFNCIILETGFLDSVKEIQNGVFDEVEDKFKIFSSSENVYFLNGVSQYSGNKLNSGTLYSPQYYLERDFNLNNNYIDSLNFYNEKDYFWYKKISGVIYYNEVVCSGNSSFNITGNYNQPENSIVFLNGQKLSSGKDFTYNLSFLPTYLQINFNSNFENITGVLSVIYLEGKRKELTGSFAFKTVELGFNSDYTFLFMNGQGQIDGSDYIISDINSLLSGSGIFSTGRSVIFNNDERFFE